MKRVSEDYNFYQRLINTRFYPPYRDNSRKPCIHGKNKSNTLFESERTTQQTVKIRSIKKSSNFYLITREIKALSTASLTMNDAESILPFGNKLILQVKL